MNYIRVLTAIFHFQSSFVVTLSILRGRNLKMHRDFNDKGLSSPYRDSSRLKVERFLDI